MDRPKRIFPKFDKDPPHQTNQPQHPSVTTHLSPPRDSLNFKNEYNSTSGPRQLHMAHQNDGAFSSLRCMVASITTTLHTSFSAFQGDSASTLPRNTKRGKDAAKVNRAFGGN